MSHQPVTGIGTNQDDPARIRQGRAGSVPLPEMEFILKRSLYIKVVTVMINSSLKTSSSQNKYTAGCILYRRISARFFGCLLLCLLVSLLACFLVHLYTVQHTSDNSHRVRRDMVNGAVNSLMYSSNPIFGPGLFIMNPVLFLVGY